jgi:hypothetical protein
MGGVTLRFGPSESAQRVAGFERPEGAEPDASAANNALDLVSAERVYSWLLLRRVHVRVVARGALCELPMRMFKEKAEEHPLDPVVKYIRRAQDQGLVSLWKRVCRGAIPNRDKKWFFSAFCAVQPAEFERKGYGKLSEFYPIDRRLDGWVKPYDTVALVCALAADDDPEFAPIFNFREAKAAPSTYVFGVETAVPAAPFAEIMGQILDSVVQSRLSGYARFRARTPEAARSLVPRGASMAAVAMVLRQCCLMGAWRGGPAGFPGARPRVPQPGAPPYHLTLADAECAFVRSIVAAAHSGGPQGGTRARLSIDGAAGTRRGSVVGARARGTTGAGDGALGGGGGSLGGGGVGLLSITSGGGGIGGGGSGGGGARGRSRCGSLVGADGRASGLANACASQPGVGAAESGNAACRGAESAAEGAAVVDADETLGPRTVELCSMPQLIGALIRIAFALGRKATPDAPHAAQIAALPARFNALLREGVRPNLPLRPSERLRAPQPATRTLRTRARLCPMHRASVGSVCARGRSFAWQGAPH